MSYEGLEYERPEGASRKERLKDIKRGPGYFAYNGKALSIEDTPTYKMSNKRMYKYNPDGTLALDAQGRPRMVSAGIPERDVNGRPMLGGEPKRAYTPIETYTMWGVEFPPGKPVYVSKKSLALKLRCSPYFNEVEKPSEEEAPAKRKPGRPKKAE